MMVTFFTSEACNFRKPVYKKSIRNRKSFALVQVLLQCLQRWMHCWKPKRVKGIVEKYIGGFSATNLMSCLVPITNEKGKFCNRNRVWN